jgi:NAD(P)-dependent dehydrogenase (short-subunit alcohol dehydrogenase family)
VPIEPTLAGVPPTELFEGRVAIVTGAGRGLGRAYAELLARMGARVVANDIDPSELERWTGAGGTASAPRMVTVVADVRRTDGAEAVVAVAEERFGRLDVVVNNAGIAAKRTFSDLTLGDLDHMVSVHLGGHFNVTKAAWPLLTRSDAGRVINTTSNAALYGMPNNVHYAAAKGAIMGLTVSLAREVEHTAMRVNAVAPGAFTEMAVSAMDDTEHLEWMRVRMRAESVAPVVAWLGHPACRLNGRIFDVRGGRFAEVLVGLGDAFPADDVHGAAEAPLDRKVHVVPETIVEAAHWLLEPELDGKDIP